MLRYLLPLCLVAAHLHAQVREEYTVVVASRDTYADAELLMKLMLKKGVQAVVYKSTATPVRYRVCSGRYANAGDALRAKEKLAPTTGYSDMWVMKLDAMNQPVPPAGLAQSPPTNLPPTVANPTPTPAPTPPPPAKAAAALADTMRFITVYRTVLDLMRADSRQALDAYIHPEQGLYVLYNPGAHVVAERVGAFQDIYLGALPSSDEGLAQYSADVLRYANEVPAFGKLPVYDCEAKSYAHLGAFCSTLTEQDKMLARLLASQKEFALGQQLTPAERAVATAADANLKVAVVNTQASMIHTLYFARVDGRWYLAVIDLVKPCGTP